MRTKLFTLSAVLTACMLMAGAEVAQAQNLRRKAFNEVKPKEDAVLPFIAKGNKDMSMYPSKVSYYYRDYPEEYPELTEINWLKYLKPGVVSERETNDISARTFVKKFYKYDENDQVTEVLAGYKESHEADDIKYFERKEIAYDDIVKDMVTKIDVFRPEEYPEWEYDSWNVKKYTEDRIVRDDMNRILSIKEWYWDEAMEKEMPTIYNENVYGEGAGPEKMSLYHFDEDGSKILVTYLDSLEWVKCDNQVPDLNFADVIHGINLKNNILSKAHMVECNDPDVHTSINYTYDDRNRISVREEFISIPEYEMSGIITYVYEYPDDNGTTKIYTYETYDNNDNGKYEEDEKVLTEYSVKEYNDKKLLTLDYCYTKDYNDDDDSWQRYPYDIWEYDYDDMGRVTEARRYYLNDDDEKYFSKKYELEYDDNATGIASVNRNGMDLKVNGNVVSFGGAEGRYMVCNADGRLVMCGSTADGWVSLENLPAGLYIVKVNGCAVKVIR